MCAERTAVHAAIAQGIREIVAIAVLASNESPTWPCGACRQVLHEFGPGMLVIAEGSSGERMQKHLGELLPEAFGPDDLR